MFVLRGVCVKKKYFAEKHSYTMDVYSYFLKNIPGYDRRTLREYKDSHIYLLFFNDDWFSEYSTA
jgi:hypothetical protein